MRPFNSAWLMFLFAYDINLSRAGKMESIHQIGLPNLSKIVSWVSNFGPLKKSTRGGLGPWVGDKYLFFCKKTWKFVNL